MDNIWPNKIRLHQQGPELEIWNQHSRKRHVLLPLEILCRGGGIVIQTEKGTPALPTARNTVLSSLIQGRKSFITNANL